MHILGSHTKIWGKKGQSVLTPIVVIENMENSMKAMTYPIVLCPWLQQGSTTAGIGNTSSSSNGEDGGGNIGFDLINSLLGFDNAESRMTELVTQINYFLTGKFVDIHYFPT